MIKDLMYTCGLLSLWSRRGLSTYTLGWRFIVFVHTEKCKKGKWCHRRSWEQHTVRQKNEHTQKRWCAGASFVSDLLTESSWKQIYNHEVLSTNFIMINGMLLKDKEEYRTPCFYGLTREIVLSLTYYKSIWDGSDVHWMCVSAFSALFTGELLNT